MISSLSRILSAFITLLLLVECSSNKTGMFMYFVDILLIFFSQSVINSCYFNM